MKTRVLLNEDGGITIPESVRDELGILPDDALEIESDAMVLRSVPETPSLTKEQGIWVLYTGQPLPASATEDVLEQIREERDLAHQSTKE